MNIKSFLTLPFAIVGFVLILLLAWILNLAEWFKRRRVPDLAIISTVCMVLSSCATSDGTAAFSNYSVVYTGTAVEVSNFATPVEPGKEAVTASGVGWDTKAKTAYVLYADGHTTRFGKLNGGGFGGGMAILTFEGGMRITVNLKTRAVTVIQSPFVVAK